MPRSTLESAFRTLAVAGYAVISLIPFHATLIYKWPWLGFCQLLILASTLGAWVLFWASPRVQKERRESRVLPGLLLMALILCLISSLSSPYSNRAALSLLIPAGAWSLGFVVYARISSSAKPQTSLLRSARWLAAFCVAIHLESLILWLLLDQAEVSARFANLRASAGPFFDQPGLLDLQNIYPFGHANFTAGFALLALPLVLIVAVIEGKARRPIWLVGGLLILAVLVTSGSRAGLLALGAQCACATVLFMGSRTRLSIRRLLAVSGAITLFMILLFTIHPRARQTLAYLAAGERISASDSERFELTRTGLAMVADKPLFGHGAGTTSLVFPEFRRGNGILPNAYQVHNTPVQLACDLGLPFLAVILGLVILAGYAALQSARADGSSHALTRRLSVGLGSALCGYFLFSFTDFQLDVYAITGLLALEVGLLAAAYRLQITATQSGLKRSHSRPPWNLQMLLAITVTGLFIFWLVFKQVKTARARHAFARGVESLEQGDLRAFEEAALRAHGHTPSDTFYLNCLGWELARQAGISAGGKNEVELSAKAALYWRNSLAINPTQEFCHYNLGWLYLSREPKQALLHFAAAFEMDPFKRGVLFGMALTFKNLDRMDAALEALALECITQPAFVTFAHWDQANFRRTLPDVTTRIREYYDYLIAAPRIDDELGARLRIHEAVILWWMGDRSILERMDLRKRAFADVFVRLMRGEVANETLLREARRYPGALIYRATRERDPVRRRALIEAAYILSETVPPTREDLQRVSDLIADGDPPIYDLLGRTELRDLSPIRIFWNERPAFSLLHRHPDEFKAKDLFFYEKYLLAEALVEPLFPRRSLIPAPLIWEIAQAFLPGESNWRDHEKKP